MRPQNARWLLVIAVGWIPAWAGAQAAAIAPASPYAPAQGPTWTPTPAPRPVYLQDLAREQSPVPNPAASGLQIQNLDGGHPATVTVDFYREFGWSSFTAGLPPVPPLFAANLYLPSHGGLGDGWFAARAAANRSIAAVARTEWLGTGGAVMFANSLESTHLAVPLVMRRYAGQTSVIRIQNTDTARNAHVLAKLYAFGEFTTRLTRSYNLRPGGFVTLDLGDDASFGVVGEPFVGWLLVESATPVAATARVGYDNGSPAVFAFEGLPLEHASPRLAVPLFRHDFYGTTGISVVSLTSDNEVEVTYRGTLGSCAGREFSQGPVRLGRYAGAVFYQGNVDLPMTGTSPLPPGCGGSATVEATNGPLLAVVNDATGNPARPSSAAAYNAVGVGAGRRIALPLWRMHHTRHRLTTGVQAMNVGTAAARATLKVYWSDGSTANCGAACQATVPPGYAFTWYPATLPAMREGDFGSAFLDSDQPLAVIVNDASAAGTMDAAIYGGIVVQE